MVRRWLITGGLGFLGRNLVRSLVGKKDNFIRIVDNLKVGSRDDLKDICHFNEVTSHDIQKPGSRIGVELLVGDIRSPDLAVKACDSFDVIVHLAANTGVAPSVADPKMDCEVNVFGTLNYLEAARICGVPRFVFASSGAPAGEVEPPIHEELAPHPVSPYGASKLAGEGYCSAYFNTFGVETVCLRFGNVYGPLSGKKDSVVARFIKRAINGKPLQIYGDGSQTRDFIYVDDLIKAIHLATTAPDVGGEVFQIATNRETTVLEMLDQLLDCLAEKGIHDVHTIFKEKRQGDVMRNYSDTSKARRMLAWQAENDLSTGLAKTVDWFIRQTG